MRSRKPHQRILLPNGCSISKPSIHPANWDKPGALISFDWYIHYRYYDPAIKPGERFYKGRQCITKGMNDCKTLPERRSSTKQLLNNELELLQTRGYNQITKTAPVPGIDVGDINEQSPLLPSLQVAFAGLKYEPETLADVKSVLKYSRIAICDLEYDRMPLIQVRKKHIKAILEQCGKNQDFRSKYNPEKLNKPPVPWSADRHNKYRAYLMSLFKELCQIDAIDVNPVSGTLKKKGIKKIKQVLTKKEMTAISRSLKKDFYRFWLFLNIFYPSGSREIELMRLRGKNVDLKNQRFTRLVKKGGTFEEVETTITNTALPFWKKVMAGCGANDFIFSVGLMPGPRKIRTEQIGRRWRRAVKIGMGINVDCYALKHLFTTGVVDQLDEKAAASHNAHKTTAMVVNIYDTQQERRKHERMKKINLKFS